MSRESGDPEAENRNCSDWAEIAKCLEEFPPPEIGIDYEGEVTSEAWVFRGLQSSSYELQPAIERAAESKGMPWSALEVLVSSEFKSRAHMHFSAHSIPQDEFTWLAQMQHYSIPTRLLDFTYSPFVALYFAIRNSQKVLGTHLRLWAIDARAVNDRFRTVAWKAKTKNARRNKNARGSRQPQPT